jgi:hypothetical protein
MVAIAISAQPTLAHVGCEDLQIGAVDQAITVGVKDSEGPCGRAVKERLPEGKRVDAVY